MKNIFFILLLCLAGLASQAQYTDVTGDITTNTTWTANNMYRLNGYVHVDSGVTLTILPGTVIVGKADDGTGSILSTLIVDRGAKLVAEGTANQPIVFTSELPPDGTRSYGDWGGIVLCGAATINQAGGQAEVEGTPAGTTSYGGSNDDDSSGVLKYVRIEFGGIPLQPNKEINGLTFCGVGRKTVIDYVQCSYIGDDSYEWFGGTVNCKHLVAFRGWDDDFDTDNGFRGKVQFCVSMRDSNVADQSGSNGFESDNDASGSTNSPNTAGIFSNMTVCGPLSYAGSTYNSLFKRGMHLRRNTKLSVHNSIIMGWPTAFLLDGSLTETNATNNDIQVRNNIISGCIDSFAVVTGSTFDLRSWYYTPSFANEYVSANSYVNLTAPFNYAAPNFMPAVSSPALSGADFTNGNVNDPWFTVVNYRGAFGSTDWTAGWTNWTPVTTTYTAVGIEKEQSGLSVARVFPNPAAGSVTLEFFLKNGSESRIDLLDIKGRELRNLQNGSLNAGLNTLAIDLSELPGGFYFARIQTLEGSKTVKISKL